MFFDKLLFVQLMNSEKEIHFIFCSFKSDYFLDFVIYFHSKWSELQVSYELLF